MLYDIYMIKKILLTFITSILLSETVFAEKVVVFNFTQEELKSLKVRKVKGETTWSFGSNSNGNFIRAEAEGVGSGLGKQIEIDLQKTPFINITWNFGVPNASPIEDVIIAIILSILSMSLKKFIK